MSDYVLESKNQFSKAFQQKDITNVPGRHRGKHEKGKQKFHIRDTRLSNTTKG
jgi:hypothetical protein